MTLPAGELSPVCCAVVTSSVAVVNLAAFTVGGVSISVVMRDKVAVFVVVDVVVVATCVVAGVAVAGVKILFFPVEVKNLRRIKSSFSHCRKLLMLNNLIFSWLPPRSR